MTKIAKTSVELTQKAAGYMLAAANACKREMNEKEPASKETTSKKTSPKASKTKK